MRLLRANGYREWSPNLIFIGIFLKIDEISDIVQI